MAISRVPSVLTCVLLPVCFGAVNNDGRSAQYIYDGLGRLSHMIDGQCNVATYTYVDGGTGEHAVHTGMQQQGVTHQAGRSAPDAGQQVLRALLDLPALELTLL